ncbi:hypothetical protein BEL04_18610 [Mucilaginibacter sp. PPCGB 2223]|uniref:hypothetical protein n=1 Tax=Mucilaginibacter sp. PPCGB 2223 TaxID=1886027 RepID=UPI0008242264|nr:hypothetical protein [Mucilaginibacter sp. PPCGB 2223]OCX50748.1 hypothetical protein BEL04_18610 [Mucilaginibacter sp. PPCGB 2223]
MSLTDPIQMDDIQGLILRGYNYDFIRYIVLTIPDNKEAIQGARQFCADLLPGSKAPGLKITDATPWVNGKPPYCLNIGFTIYGLNRLIGEPNCATLNNTSYQLFNSFSLGAVSDAEFVGDTGTSDPQYWWTRSGGWLPGTAPAANGNDLHMQLTLYARNPENREEYYGKLLAMIPKTATGDLCVQPVFVKDSDPVIVDGDPTYIHFGYKDSLSQPRIAHSPWNILEEIAGDPDDRPMVPADRFIISTDAPDYQAHPFLKNGTFAAFRLLYQDVGAFEEFISSDPATPPELMAAKMCGRWRDGTPLVVSPNKPDPHLKGFDYTNFDYLAPTRHQKGNMVSDADALRCPYASHIRRANPRDDTYVQGNVDLGTGKPVYAVTHRILRRASPYGPPYKSTEPKTPQIQRGLVGLFIGAVLDFQFRFIMSTWLEAGSFRTPDNSPNSSGVDPLFGPRTDDTYEPDLEFAFAVPNITQGPVTYHTAPQNMQRYVRTDGSLYVFIPGIEGLKWISQGNIS